MTAPCDLSAVEQRRRIRDGDLSASELLESCLARIEAVNPAVNAIVTLDADGARDRARAADEAQARGDELPLLHGLVVAHKDMLATAGMRTTLGSRLFAHSVPGEDAALAARLRRAGIVRIGKTNVPELGLGSHTVNAVFGATRNPYDLTRSAGGSSGGAAAALATGMVSLADGGDFGGSLRNPASFCNVVGMRPPIGRVTDAPVRVSWPRWAVLGPMARDVADLALLYAAMVGHDADDPASLDTDPRIFLEIAEEQPRDSLAGVRVAWTPDLGELPVDPEVAAVLAGAGLGALSGLGAQIVPWDADFSGADEAFRTFRAWMLHGLFGRVLDDIRPLVGANLVDNVSAGATLTADDLYRALELQTALRARIVAVFHSADVLAMPTVQIPPFPIEWDWPREVAGWVQCDYLEWMRSCWYVTLTDLPAISVPCGFTAGGLPVGIQLVGRPLGEAALLRIARAVELATGASRRRPALS